MFYQETLSFEIVIGFHVPQVSANMVGVLWCLEFGSVHVPTSQVLGSSPSGSCQDWHFEQGSVASVTGKALAVPILFLSPLKNNFYLTLIPRGYKL